MKFPYCIKFHLKICENWPMGHSGILTVGRTPFMYALTMLVPLSNCYEIELANLRGPIALSAEEKDFFIAMFHDFQVERLAIFRQRQEEVVAGKCDVADYYDTIELEREVDLWPEIFNALHSSKFGLASPELN